MKKLKKMLFGVMIKLMMLNHCTLNKYKKYWLSLLLLIIGQGIFCQLNIGRKIPDNIKIDSSILVLVSPVELRDGFAIHYNEIEFSICIDKDSILTYIETRDKSFHTEEGIFVGLKYSEVRKYSISNSKIIKGFGYIVPLQSGWNAGFLLQPNTKNMFNDSTIYWIYKKY